MRSVRSVWLVLVGACGGTSAPPADSAPPSELEVTLLAPNGGEALVAAEDTAIRWSALEGEATVDLDLIDGAGAATPIATDLPSPVGQEGSFTWSPPGVPAPSSYRVRVTITDTGGGTASDESDADLTISPPAQGISLAADLGPIFEAKCNTAGCHNNTTQASGLVLTLGKAHASMVGIKSRHTACNTFDRVVPGSPTTSFLVFKLQGNGACFAGTRMPKNAAALPANEIQLVRDWITEGAKNN